MKKEGGRKKVVGIQAGSGRGRGTEEELGSWLRCRGWGWRKMEKRGVKIDRRNKGEECAGQEKVKHSRGEG